MAIAHDEFPLPAPDGDQRINGLDAGLQGHGDWRPVHDGRRGALDGQATARHHRSAAVQMPSERIEDAPYQAVAHGHVHDAARAFHFIPGLQIPIAAQQDANFIFVQVERDAGAAARKQEQFFETCVGKARDLGDAGGQGRDPARLAWLQAGTEGFARAPQVRERAVEERCEISGRGVHANSSPKLFSIAPR